MVESAVGRASVAANQALQKQAMKMLFALDTGEIGTWLCDMDTAASEARNSLDAERLELLESVHQELRKPRSGSADVQREVCADLLAHLCGGQIRERRATIH